MLQATRIGVGLYSYPEAARIIGVPASTLRQWAKGYYAPRDVTRPRKPVIDRQFGDEPFITFLELVELLLVKLFRQEGVSMQTIRRASARAKQLFDTPYPFATRRFDTDGTRLFATLEREDDSTPTIADMGKGQFAFEQVVRPFFRKLDFGDDGLALAFWPHGRDKRIVIDPKRSFGKPIDAETGVPTTVLADAVYARDGQSVDDVARWYDVPVTAVRAALDYEQSPSVA